MYACYRDEGDEAKANEWVHILCRASPTYVLSESFLKKLIGRKDIEDALQRLDKLEQGELRTVTAQVLKTTSDLKVATSDLRGVTDVLKEATRDLKDGT